MVKEKGTPVVEFIASVRSHAALVKQVSKHIHISPMHRRYRQRRVCRHLHNFVGT